MEGLKVLNLTAAHPHLRAGIVAYDFHKNLQQHGCESKLLTLCFDKFEDPSIISYRKGPYDQLLKRGWNQLQKRKELQIKSHPDYYFANEDLTTSPNSTKSILNRLDGFRPDIIIVHFAQSFLTTQNLQELNKATGAPIYWYIMDMKPMTGGCAYAWDCKGYQNQCGKCPAIYSEKENDLSSENLAFNKKNIDNTELIVIAASSLTKKQAMKSSVFKNKNIHQLYIAINSEEFRPLSNDERIEFAVKHDLDAADNHLFFGAVKPGQRRKGFKELMEALEILQQSLSEDLKQQCHLIIAGEESEEIISALNKIGLNHSFLGFLNHEELAQTFAFSTAFLCPTLQDAGPMMVNQSLMAGTPVVSFKMGVSIDFIDEKKGTGALIEIGNVAAFANGIHRLLQIDTDTEAQNRMACRNLALEKFSYEAQYKSFKDIAEKELSNYAS